MLLRPDRDDLRIVGLNTGRVLIAVGAVMLVPAAYGVVRGEYNEAAAFLIGGSLAAIPGLVAELVLRPRRPARWNHGMAISALSWLVAPLFGAVPLFLSGHYGSYLDAYFDAMSGFVTAGLAVINDLDHLADSVNLWRHVMQFLGGQGLVLMMLSLFAARSGAVGMYVAEAREEKILPNVVTTARFIWRVSLTYFTAGTTALWLALVAAGLPVGRALFHATTLFMAGFDTGGFAPHSTSIGFYHSAVVEAIVGVLMVAGAFSFAVHYRLWQRRQGELLRNVEARFLAASLLGLFLVLAVGLARAGPYESVEALLRRGLFHLLSAHTGTGFGTIPGRMFVTDWGVLAPAAIVFAMGMGPMAGSTAGGIKAIRLALVGKSIQQSIRRLMLPESAVLVSSYDSGGRQVLRDETVRSALMILLLYLGLYLLGALVGLFYGIPFDQAMFESTSASAAVGLSIGLTGPDLETGLKVVYIFQMWIGRLEFVAVFTLMGFVFSALRGRT